jgi:hypothetical protein
MKRKTLLITIALLVFLAGCSEKERSTVHPATQSNTFVPAASSTTTSASEVSAVSGVKAVASQPANTLTHEKFERIINKQFPGFHIMREDDFPKMYKGRFRDGQSGSLIYGNFDSDKYVDFAALLIGAKQNEYAYDSITAICHGDNNGNYTCEKMVEGAHYSESDDEISLVPRGTYNCLEGNDESSESTLQFDAIGSYSEHGGGIYEPKGDGTYNMCVTSD